MSHPREDPPTAWSPLQPLLDVGGGVYVYVGPDQQVGQKAEHVIVYHWHMPTTGGAGANRPRWQATRCGLHDVIALEPLHLEASLACEDGCPAHGWIRDGRWTDA